MVLNMTPAVVVKSGRGSVHVGCGRAGHDVRALAIAAAGAAPASAQGGPMKRLRSLISQSPAIAVAAAALALSVCGGATAAVVASHPAASPVRWHKLTLINGWRYGGFGAFPAPEYVQPHHVVHLPRSARPGRRAP